jgi:hypothetical protein
MVQLPFQGDPPFWLVWSPEGLSPPQKRYASRKEAQAAARIMARVVGNGSVFYVLKAQSYHQQQLKMVDWQMVPWGIGAPCPYHAAS